MAWARIATVNEDFLPLIGVEVECFDVDTLAVISVVASDLGGIVLFTGLPDTQRFFFKVRARRVSTRVQSVLDPATGRTYTGQVRLQILSSSPGSLGKHAVVDKTGHGTHTTIQAAITDIIAASVPTDVVVIHVNPGVYTEALTITTSAGHATRVILEAQGAPVSLIPTPGYNYLVKVTGVANADILTLAGTFISLTLKGLALVAVGTAYALKETTSSDSDIYVQDCDLEGAIQCQGVFHAVHSVLNYGDLLLNVDGADQTQWIFNHCYVSGGPIAAGGTNRYGSFRAASCQFIQTTDNATPLIQIDSLSLGYGGFQVSDSTFELTDCHNVAIYVKLAHGHQNHVRITDNLFKGPGKTHADGSAAIQLRGVFGGTVVGNIIGNYPVGVLFEADILGRANLGVVAKANSFMSVGTAYEAEDDALDATSEIGNSAYEDVTTEKDNIPAVADADAHNLLDGVVHPDTLLGAVLDGDTIIGNATPKWSRLAISIPAANVRNVLGIDNAELRPSWKTALDATDPANIAAAASAGTSLIFSHRDHVHAHPVFAGGDLHTEYLTQSEADLLYAPIGGAHAAVTLSATLDSNLLGLTGQQLTLDTQAANLIFAGPVSGAVAAPTFRSLVAADLGTGAPDGTKYLRDDLTWQAVAGGGAHALLSVTHSDTLADNVLDGDTIIGNATPKWSKLAISVPGAVALLNVLGIVTGETRPSWKALFDTTNPTTIGVSDVAAPGTQTIAAHRDHQHGSPATFPAVAHALLSATHSDILADSVLAGDVMIGNDTPKWSRLAISVPAANVRNVLGVDNGETTPSWKTALDDTHPADIAAAATEGTSLVFSHRDHVHAHPAIAGDLHTGYFLLAGRAGGQVAYGGTGAGDDLTLKSTSHGTKGSIFLDELDGLLVKGYTRVGSLTAPANVTAGDLTAVRLSIGNATLATGQVFYVYNASVANASATNALITASFTPTANGAYEMRGLEGQARYYGAFNNTNGLYGGVFEASVGGTGKVNYLAALYGIGLHLRTGAGAAMAVGDARSLSFQLVYGSGRAAGEIATIDALTGVRIDSGYSTLIAGDVVTNAYGIYMQNMGDAKVTNAYGIYIAGVSLAATLNIGIKLNGCTTAALWLNSDTAAEGVIVWGTTRDTNLYRGGADILYSDDSFRLAGHLKVGAVAAPTNTTAGDLTAIRAILGTDEAFGASVLLDLNSVTGALLLSRMTTAQKVALTGVAGMVLYDATLGQFAAYDGAWKQVILVGTPADYTVSNVTTDRTYDANATTIDEIADIVGTLISDLQSIGLLQ